MVDGVGRVGVGKHEMIFVYRAYYLIVCSRRVTKLASTINPLPLHPRNLQRNIESIFNHKTD